MNASCHPQWTAGNSTSISGLSQCRSAAAPYESHVWRAALIRSVSASVNTNSLAGIERAEFQITPDFQRVRPAVQAVPNAEIRPMRNAHGGLEGLEFSLIHRSTRDDSRGAQRPRNRPKSVRRRVPKTRWANFPDRLPRPPPPSAASYYFLAGVNGVRRILSEIGIPVLGRLMGSYSSRSRCSSS